MSEESLFGELSPPEPPKRHVTKAPPAPRKPTAKELRERAPEPQRRAPEKKLDTELDEVVRNLAAHDMLAPEELEKYSEAVEPVISKKSRDNLREWRQKHGS